MQCYIKEKQKETEGKNFTEIIEKKKKTIGTKLITYTKKLKLKI